MEMNTAHSAAPAAPHVESSASRRLRYGLNVSVLVISLLVILVAVNWLAAISPLRADLTAAREYSVSLQTQSLLKSLAEPVTLHLVFIEREAGGLRKQVDDVLAEFTRRSDNVRVERLDPTNALDVVKQDALVEQLKTIYADEIDAYSDAAAKGSEALKSLAEFATSENSVFTEATVGLTQGIPGYADYRTITQILPALPGDVELFQERVKAALETSAGQSLPDWNGAVSTLRSAITLRSQTMKQVADFFENAAKGDSSQLPAALSNYLLPAAQRFRSVAETLGKAQDLIQDLEPLQIEPISRALGQSNCIIVTGSTRASTIPFEDLFPTPSAQEVRDKQRIDRRFSGERVIAAGIRRVTMDKKPRCVIVHAEPPPGVLMNRGQGNDVARVAEALRDLGFDVSDWNVTSSQNRPTFPESAGPIAWVVYPQQPPGMDQMSAPVVLADVARQLVRDGQNVLVSYWPSQVAVFSQRDVWADVTEPLGVTPDSARVIFEQVPDPQSTGGLASRSVIDFTDYVSDHPIAKALTALPTRLAAAVPLIIAPPPDVASGEGDEAGPSPQMIKHSVVLEAAPTDRLFASGQWMGQEVISPPPADQRDTKPYPLVVAVEKALVDGTAQRALVVGSGPWFYTGMLDQMALVDNVLLTANPGNVELFVNAVLWLTGQDDQIAPSALARSAPRIAQISGVARAGWWWILVGGLPVLSLLAGGIVWIFRRD